MPGTPFFRLPGTKTPLFVPSSFLPGANTPHSAPGNPFLLSPGAKKNLFAPGTVLELGCRHQKRPKLAPTGVLKPGSAPKSGKISTEIRRSGPANDEKRQPERWDVREPAPVGLCCRGVCGGRAGGAAAALTTIAIATRCRTWSGSETAGIGKLAVLY